MPGTDSTLTVEVDHHMIAVHGGWWYRAEYEIAPVGPRTLLTHRVLDAATWCRWMVPVVLAQYRLSGTAGPTVTVRQRRLAERIERALAERRPVRTA